MTRNEVINILKENRELIIKQIKVNFKKVLSFSNISLADAMNYLIDYCVEYNDDLVKNGWKCAVIKASNKMYDLKKEEWNIKVYGIAHPKMADMQEHYELTHEE